MLMDKYTQFAYYEILEPRYHNKTVLLKASKVREHNKIVFTKAPSMGTLPYYVSGKVVKKCRKDNNGVIAVYVVPLIKLENLELSQNSEMEWK